MYKVYCDTYLLHDLNTKELHLLNPTLRLAENKVGEFTFTILPNHPYFDFIDKLTSVIKVYDDSTLLFKGRVLNTEQGFQNEITATCEGVLAHFFDTVMRPFDFTGSVTDFLTLIINQHNAQVPAGKQFKVGTITVVDPLIVRSSIDYLKTWEVIEGRLLNLLGGHLVVRYEADGDYIDYLSDYATMNSQPIKYAYNLLDLKKYVKGDKIISALLPLGAKVGDNRLTISDVNGGVDYITNASAVAEYGYILGVNIWDDVTVADNLLTKATAYLTDMANFINTIELNALDLSAIDTSITSFRIGSMVQVESTPHGLASNFVVDEIEIKLTNPDGNRVKLGKSFKTFTDKAVGAIKGSTDYIRIVESTNAVNLEQAIMQLEQVLMSQIETTATGIRSEVSESYFTQNAANTLISQTSTQFTQTAEDYTLKFTTVQNAINALNDATGGKFTEIYSWIRMENGNIILGKGDSQIILRLTNDRVQFLQNGNEVAYFSNNKLYVYDGAFINSSSIGNYTWIVEDNGSLSLA